MLTAPTKCEIKEISTNDDYLLKSSATSSLRCFRCRAVLRGCFWSCFLWLVHLVDSVQHNFRVIHFRGNIMRDVLPMSMKRVDYVRAQIIVFLTPLLKGVVPVQYMTTFVASILCLQSSNQNTVACRAQDSQRVNRQSLSFDNNPP